MPLAALANSIQQQSPATAALPPACDRCDGHAPRECYRVGGVWPWGWTGNVSWTGQHWEFSSGVHPGRGDRIVLVLWVESVVGGLGLSLC